MNSKIFKRSTLLGCVLAALSFQSQAANPPPLPSGQALGAFYTSWSNWRGTPGVKHIKMLDEIKPTYISYAFFAPKVSTDGQKPTYGGAQFDQDWLGQQNGTIGDIDNDVEQNVASALYADFSDYQAQYHIASIGGWSYGPRFHQFVEDANYDVNTDAAKAFIKSCVDLLAGKLVLNGHATYPQFDGINIDWEYPGYVRGQTQIDHRETAFFAALVQKLRAAIDTYNTQNGIQKILTVALPVNVAKISGDGTINWKQLANNFDWIDLMAFDAHGEFDAADPNAQTPLDQGDTTDTQNAIEYLIKNGVNSRRIILGIPNYTREMLVDTLPTQDNDYTYGEKGKGTMNPAHIKGLALYIPDTTFADPPNPDPYYPVGGMVDNTGVYGYSCILKIKHPGHGSNCFAPETTPAYTDNRGLFGQPLPSDLKTTTITDKDGTHAWAYSTQQSVVQSPQAGSHMSISGATYGGYPVFSYDSPDVVKQKIQNLVIKEKLGGAWFWDIHNDAYDDRDAQYSLYRTAASALSIKP